jgi:DNA-directed RNA polymerase specialized sigma subunit
MTTTARRAVKGRRLSAREKARMSARRALKAWLAKLPKELAEDLEELFAMMSAANADQDRKEIAATITELLYPDTLIVELDDTQRLDVDDPVARKRLQDYRKAIGKEIVRFRKAKGMSQAQLGEAVGISQSHVSRLETGFHIPTHVTLEKVAEVLGVCPSKIDPGFESTGTQDDE